MPDTSTSSEQPSLTVPKNWTKAIQAAGLQVIALAQHALSYTRSSAANSPNARIRLTAKADQLDQEVALLREELRIKDARMAEIPAARRPHYRPTRRLAILELRAPLQVASPDCQRLPGHGGDDRLLGQTPRRERAQRLVAHA